MARFPRLGFCAPLLLLAACGSGDEAVLVEACEKDGGTTEYCECRSDVLMDALDKDDRTLLVKLTRLRLDEGLADDKALARLFQDRSPTELMTFQFAVMAPLVKAEEKCR
ncbi:MAG: hypothetical protein GC201_13595 [Alphaproteobacteria bacterium]|nr:hypothetical protein [Alphaproteobacteria bacterium]